MYFKKTLSIALANWKVLVKSLLCQLVAFVMLLAVGTFAFGTLVNDIFVAFESNGVNDFVTHVVQSIATDTFDGQHFVSTDLPDLLNSVITSIQSVPNLANRVEISVVIMVLGFVLYRVLISFTDVAVGCQLNEFMDSNATRPFSWYFLKKFGRSIAFVFLQLLFALVFDTLIIATSILLAVIVLSVFRFNAWAIAPVILLAILLYVVRYTFMAYCLPSVVHQYDKKVSQAFRDGLSHVMYSFGKAFLHTLIVLFVMIATTLVAYFFDENRWIALAISAVVNFILFYILKCVNFVMYYESNNYPYFHKAILLEGTEKFNRKNKSKN